MGEPADAAPGAVRASPGANTGTPGEGSEPVTVKVAW